MPGNCHLVCAFCISYQCTTLRSTYTTACAHAFTQCSDLMHASAVIFAKEYAKASSVSLAIAYTSRFSFRSSALFRDRCMRLCRTRAILGPTAVSLDIALLHNAITVAVFSAYIRQYRDKTNIVLQYTAAAVVTHAEATWVIERHGNQQIIANSSRSSSSASDMLSLCLMLVLLG
jgi:hypothetical protein